MLADKSVRSRNIGTGSVMEEHLNSSVLDRLKAIEDKLKELAGSQSDGKRNKNKRKRMITDG